MLKTYYSLTKPGIVYGNALSAVAGFALAAQGDIDLIPFAAMLLGISFVVASGCVFNNYLDQDIDGLMERTKSRALVCGAISETRALIFGAALGIVGTLALALFANLIAAAVALFGFIMYVVVYSMWLKRHTLHATLVGAVSGAVPPVVGYAASSATLDIGAVLVFLILFAWQMPHALAIAIRRYKDYEAASIPVMPIARSVKAAKYQVILYAFVFTLAAVSLSFAGITGYVFGITLGLFGLAWLGYAVRGLKTLGDELWAKQIFQFSLIILLVFCIMSALTGYLP